MRLDGTSRARGRFAFRSLVSGSVRGLVCAGAILVGGLLPEGGEAACEGLTGMDAARCARQAQATPAWPTQANAVPQFDPTNQGPTHLFSTSGNPTALNQEGAQAQSQSQMFQTLRSAWPEIQAIQQSGSPALQQAREIFAQARRASGVSETCSVQTVCTQRAQDATETVTCRQPAAEMQICSQAHAQAQLLAPGQFSPVNNGVHNPISGFCDYHWHDRSDQYGLSGDCFIYKVTQYDTSVWPWRFQLCSKTWYRYKGETFPVNESCVWVNEGAPFSGVIVQSYQQAGSGCCNTIVPKVTADGTIANGYGQVTFTVSLPDGTSGWFEHPTTILGFTYQPPQYDASQYWTSSGQPEPGCVVPPDAPAPCATTQIHCDQDFEVQMVDGTAIPVPCPQRTQYIGCQIEDTCAPYIQRGTCSTTASRCGQYDPEGRCVWFEQTLTCQVAGSCVEEHTVRLCNQCGDDNSLVPFCVAENGPPNRNFAKVSGYTELVQQFRRGFDTNSMTVFPGKVRKCEYATGLNSTLSGIQNGVMMTTISAIAAVVTGGTGTVAVIMAVASTAASGAQGGMQGADVGAWNCCALTVMTPTNLGYLGTNPGYAVPTAVKTGVAGLNSWHDFAMGAIGRAEAARDQLQQMEMGYRTMAEEMANQGNTQAAQELTTKADRLHDAINAMNDNIANAQNLANSANPADWQAASGIAQGATETGSQSASNAGSSLGSLDASSSQTLTNLGVGLLAFGAKIDAQLMNESLFGGTCDQDDFLLAAERQAKMAVYVGTRCVDWLDLGFVRGCLTREQTWCSFSSILGRIIQQEGRRQMGRDFGIVNDDRDSPDCSGFTVSDFATLRFDQMDFSDFYDKVKQGLANGEELEWIGRLKAGRFAPTGG